MNDFLSKSGIVESESGVSTPVSNLVNNAVTQFDTGAMPLAILLVSASYLLAFLFVRYLQLHFRGFQVQPDSQPLSSFISRASKLVFPITAIILLKISSGLFFAQKENIVIDLSLVVASVLLFYSMGHLLIKNKLIKRMFYLVGMPILCLHLTGLLEHVVIILDAIYFEAGNIRMSVYGVLRVVLFGTLLFWLGRLSNTTGKKIIRSQQHLDARSKEVFSKIFEILIFTAVFILLLQVMGINLTTLAVFGGAIGVGLGLGLQSIASNFISGLIILLDRSVSVGDYIELDDGQTGCVTEMSLRSTTLETYDGKDIVVPNEKFISSSFINWTHKDSKQRYRVDFSVAYDSDIRKLVELIKEAVGLHPQVITGEHVPIEERPDCEIASFGDSGINMFVEFWMEGIDDGKNRVGGDLLLTILETIRENGFEIPFPQREVRILEATPKDITPKDAKPKDANT